MKDSRPKAAAFLCAILLAVLASTAHAQKSGAWYWGDPVGSGSIGGPDLNALFQVLANPAVNDASIYVGYPQSRYRQDLDGNGSIGGPDAQVLYGWLAGNYSNRPGTPDRLLLDGTTNLNVQIGDSVTLQAYALAPAAQGSALRTGFGVNFSITGGTCTAGAEIYGYNIEGGATINTWRNPSAYHYLPTRLAPDNGRVWVKVRGSSCTYGQTTIIRVYIPDDLSAGVPQNRFPTELDAQLSPTNSTPVNFTITWSVPPPHTSIDSSPPVLSNSTDAAFSFSCDQPSCTYECNLDSTDWESCTSPVEDMLSDGPHSFSVRATIDGVTDPAPPSYSWTIDTVPPIASFTLQPPFPVMDAYTIDYAWTCNEAPCTYLCKINQQTTWSSCGNSWRFQNYPDGAQFFIYVKAIDAAGNISTNYIYGTVTGTYIDPHVYFLSGPPAATTDTWADISFVCNDGNCSYSCQLDSGSWTACTSPANLSGLSDGTHNFSINTIDQKGEPCHIPGVYTWTVETTAPDTSITSAPSNPSPSYDASFSFTATETNCTFQCSLDSGAWTNCTSPVNYSNLANGIHSFQVRAINQVNLIDPTPASYTWTVNVQLPDTNITNQPSNPTNATGAIFEFTCTTPPCSFICQLDSGATVFCNSPQTYSGLAEGSHTFTVQAIGASGNSDPTPASYTWVINPVQVSTILDSSPPNPSHSSNASFSFHCSDTPCTFDCNLDSAGWSACSSPQSYSGLADSVHSFSARAKDSFNNTDLNPPNFSWSIVTHDYWRDNTLLNTPDPRSGHTAIWTGTEMIIWGGGLNTGGRYNPTVDSWTPTSIINAPTARSLNTAVWTGAEMIIWGGTAGSIASTGGRYNPATDSWTATSTANAPSARSSHTAVWTGAEMIIWGGGTNTGGRYNPALDSWVPTSIGTNVPTSRSGHTAVWTGAEMIIWGGGPNTGGRYSPATDSWTATATTNAPVASSANTAVWTGTEMIVWGGSHSGSLNTGGRYNPVTDSWTPTSTGANVPTARYYHTAVWSGSEMIVWGGYNGSSLLNTGGRYNPATDSWGSTSIGINVPSARSGHTAIWTGSEMIVWGGGSNTGGRYDPISDSWAATNLNTYIPSSRDYHAAVWTGTQMIIWGGYYSDGSDHFFNSGGRYDPATDSWTPTSTGTNVPSARAVPTSVWTGTEMIIWGNPSNAGGRYNPATDSWIPTSVGTNVPSSRNWFSMVWTGTEMIVWGGYSSSYLRTGGRYNPLTDSWTTTTTTNAPTSRQYHSAVWTGTEMIVWGGDPTNNSGGRYNPVTDSWIPTNTNNAPAPRYQHTSVWTGTEMLIWGGLNNYGSAINTGGSYNPSSDSWSALSTLNAPTARSHHFAFWTGTEMIIWGGGIVGTNFITGGRYNPETDSWIATSMIDTPSPRWAPSMVWTGTEMIVWGGKTTGSYVNNGGRYVP